jgi:3-oxoacyl-[acyl-carrier-protein] synthase-1
VAWKRRSAVLALQHGLLPAGLNVRQPDPALQSNYLLSRAHGGRVDLVASNSFGFGGSNACLLFGAAR